MTDAKDPTTDGVIAKIRRSLALRKKETAPPEKVTRVYWRILRLAPKSGWGPVAIQGGCVFVLPPPKHGFSMRLGYARMANQKCLDNNPTPDHGEIEVLAKTGPIPLWSAATLMRAEKLGRWIAFSPNGLMDIRHDASQDDLVFGWRDACPSGLTDARFELWIQMFEILR